MALTVKQLKAIEAQCATLPWMAVAFRDLGKKEIKGSKHAEFILACARKVGLGWVRDDETPWCSTWVSGKLEFAGYPSTKSAWARSYHGGWKQGLRLSEPVFGCIVVFERGPKSGHVGFVVAIDRIAGVVWVLGGNQKDAVTIAPFPMRRVLGFYWPSTATMEKPKLFQLASAGAQLSTNEA